MHAIRAATLSLMTLAVLSAAAGIRSRHRRRGYHWDMNEEYFGLHEPRNEALYAGQVDLGER